MYFSCVLFLCSVYTLLMIALDRYVAVVTPFSMLFKRVSLKWWIALIWLLSILSAAPATLITRTTDMRYANFWWEIENSLIWGHFGLYPSNHSRNKDSNDSSSKLIASLVLVQFVRKCKLNENFAWMWHCASRKVNLQYFCKLVLIELLRLLRLWTRVLVQFNWIILLFCLQLLFFLQSDY